ncbi:MAG: hypothetical protein ACJ71T_08820 [Actinomycetales bacterium]
MTVLPGKHRGGRRSWRRRVPGVLVAVLAAASAAGVVTAALQGSGDQTAAAGALGAAATLTGGGVARGRAHRGHHRVLSANPPPMSLLTDEQLQPAVALAMSLPPLPAGTSLGSLTGSSLTADDVSAWSATSYWTPPEGSRLVPPVGPVMLRDGDAGTPWPPLSLVRLPVEPDEDDIDPMVDTVPHPVVKLFPLSVLEPDRAAGSIDDRVYAAFEAERRHAQAAAMAGRHAAAQPADAAAPRDPAYKSRHSA